METLKFLLQSKKSGSSTPMAIVEDSVSRVHQQFRNAGIPYHYSDGGAGFGRYGYFQLKSMLKETAITLHLARPKKKSVLVTEGGQHFAWSVPQSCTAGE